MGAASPFVDPFGADPGTCNASDRNLRHHRHVSDTGLRLRATSDALLRDLEALGVLEEEKRGVPPSDPRLSDHARRIHEIAARVLDRTSVQAQLSEIVSANPAAHNDTAIENIDRSPAAILAEWRSAEQRAAVIDPTTPEGSELRILADRLREEYRAAFERRREDPT